MTARCLSLAFLFLTLSATAAQRQFAGAVSSATPEATAVGVTVLEQGGNAIDAAVAVSLALGVTEPAGSGISGQTVMLVRPAAGKAFVIHGTTWSPGRLPEAVTKEQLRYGHTASTVPSTPAVLDLAQRRFGSGNIAWPKLVAPAARLAREGFVIGPFRARAFAFYGEDLLRQPAASSLFVRPDGRPYQSGEILKQPLLAGLLDRIASAGADDFYRGDIAAEIVADLAANGGWISAEDLAGFPEPRIVPALPGSYRGFDIDTLPPPFGGWVVLQILNILEQHPPESLDQDDDERRLALLDAMRIAHGSRRDDPVPDFIDFHEDVALKTSKEQAQRLLQAYRERSGGETTHFSVVDGAGLAVAVTQSIDSYFGARVAHPTLGFLYNNYMQGFRLEDDGSPFVLTARQMPLSSMSATIVTQNGQIRLVLGSPGSARIISAVAQVSSHWIDIGAGVEHAVSAFRVHALPDDRAYVEGPELSPALLGGIAERGFRLVRPTYGVSDQQLDPYFGGVHALAFENGVWTGAADPRRDGRVGYAWRTVGTVDSWSIDHAGVLFSGKRGGRQNLYLLDRASGNTRRLTETDPSTRGANFGRASPDGSRIAHQIRKTGNYDILLMDLAEESSVPLIDHPAYDVSPTWSPDGRRIAFMSTRGFELGGIGPFPGHIYILALKSGELQQVTSEPLTSSLGPSDWSADGASLLLARIIDGAPDVFLLDVESGNERRLTDTPEGEYSAVFSHDGSRIAFHAEDEDKSQIVVMNLADGSRRALTSGPGYRYNPRWSPDDAWLLFAASDSSEQYDLRAVRVDDGTVIDVLATPEDEREGDWLAD